MSTSEMLAIVSEVSASPDSLTAGDVGVISSILADLQPNELMNATVGLLVASMSIIFCHSSYSLSFIPSLIGAKYGSKRCRQSSKG